MIDSFTPRQLLSVDHHARRATIAWWLMFLGVLGVSGLIGLGFVRQDPHPGIIAWLLYFIGIGLIFYCPRYGVYMIVGFTLVADRALYPWYPFAKNFSSYESLMYLHSSLIISPLETYIAFTGIAWLGRMAMERRLKIHTGVLFWPTLLFSLFITYGLVFGIARGGNLVIALWEARAIYYLPAMLVLTSNLITHPSHVSRLLWIVAIALFIKGFAGTLFVAFVLNWDRTGVERIAEHAMSIHFNAFFVLVAAAWIYRDSKRLRLVLPLMVPFILLSFVANNRRAGFLTLIIAIGLILLLLYREHRKLFWCIAPTAAALFVVYLGIFWNNTGTLGFVARAVRSVIGEPTARDAASNIYRDLENLNSMFTIRTAPLQGVGFGNKFYIIAPMADISFFEWWEYITHNSAMWIWMKTGAGGFFAMLMTFGMSMVVGGRMIWQMPRGPLRAAALVATLYLLTHFVYTYVDMSWDTGSMVFVGTMMGLLNCLHIVAAQPAPAPVYRWPWAVKPDLVRPGKTRVQPVPGRTLRGVNGPIDA